MKEHVTTSIESDLKKLFENTKTLHGFTFGDALEQGMRTILISVNQLGIVDQEIARSDIDMSHLVQKQTNLKSIKEQLLKIKPECEVKNNGDNENSPRPELIKIRDSFFEKAKDSIIKLYCRGDVNWDSLMYKYKFNDKKEAQEWLKNKVEATQ